MSAELLGGDTGKNLLPCMCPHHSTEVALQARGGVLLGNYRRASRSRSQRVCHRQPWHFSWVQSKQSTKLPCSCVNYKPPRRVFISDGCASLDWERLLKSCWSGALTVDVSSVSLDFHSFLYWNACGFVEGLLPFFFILFFLFVPAEVSVDIFNQGSLGSDPDDYYDFLFEGILGNGIYYLFRHPTARADFCLCFSIRSWIPASLFPAVCAGSWSPS